MLLTVKEICCVKAETGAGAGAGAESTCHLQQAIECVWLSDTMYLLLLPPLPQLLHLPVPWLREGHVTDIVLSSCCQHFQSNQQCVASRDTSDYFLTQRFRDYQRIRSLLPSPFSAVIFLLINYQLCISTDISEITHKCHQNYSSNS